MPKTLILLPRAEADAYDQARYLAEHSPEAAARFGVDLRVAFDKLLRFPNLGRPWLTRNPELKGLRRLNLSASPISLFYLPTDKTIEIVRVLHHSRQLPAELEP